MPAHLIASNTSGSGAPRNEKLVGRCPAGDAATDRHDVDDCVRRKRLGPGQRAVGEPVRHLRGHLWWAPLQSRP
jgi:hypothetical protein